MTGGGMPGGGRGRRGRGDSAAINQINVTPLIDLFCLLLIVFMMVMPLLEYSVDVSPPPLNANPLPDDKESIVVNLNKDGGITLAGRTVTHEQLTAELRPQNKKTVFLRADGARPYNEVIAVMKDIKLADVKEISLITRSEN